MLVGLNLDNYTFRLVGTFISKEGVTSGILEYFANTFSGACGAFKILLSTNFLSDGNTLKGKKRRVNKTMKTLIKKVKNSLLQGLLVAVRFSSILLLSWDHA